MGKLISVCLLMFGVLGAGSSLAAVEPDAQTMSYFNSMEYKKYMFQFGVYWDRQILKIETDCQSDYDVIPVSFAILKPLVFEKDSLHPVGGAWLYRYKFRRCNNMITYNALALARPGKPPRLSALAPGETRTSPQLLGDVFKQGVATMVGVKAKDKACKSTNVLDTRITMPPTTMTVGGKEQQGVWEEEWVVKHCDEQIQMTFCFIPDGKGGTNWVANKCKKE